MAVDLKDRPDEDTGIHPEWYKPDQDNLEHAYNAPSATDDNLPSGHPDRTDSSTPSAEDIASQEKEGATASSTAEDKAEGKALGGGDEIPFRNEGVRGRFKFGRKQIIGGGVTGLLLGGSLGLFSILQGPFQVIHFMQWIDRAHFTSNNNQTNSRVTGIVRYLRSPNHPERRRLGIVMNKYADNIEGRWRKAGFDPIYDGPGSSLSEFKLRADVDTAAFTRDGINVRQNSDGTRSIMYEDLFGSGGRQAKRSFTEISKAANYNKTVSTINTRILAKRANVRFKFFSDTKRRADESTTRYYAQFRDAMASYYGGNASALDVRATTADTDNDGVADDPSGQPGADDGNNTADGVKEDIRNGGAEGYNNAKNRLSNDLSRGSGVVDLICLARGVAQMYPLIQYSNVVLPLMRTSTSVLSMGSQIMAGRNLNMDEVGAIATTLSSNEGTWVNAKSVQAEMGMPQTGKDILPSAKPSTAIGSNKALDTIDSVTSKAGMGPVCGFNNNAVGGVVVSFVTGGVTNVALDLLVGALLADADIVGFLARLVAGGGADKYPRDEEMGNYGMYGGLLGANDQALGTGARQLSDEEALELYRERKQAFAEELQDMSVAERLFNPYEPASLVSRVAMSGLVPQEPKGILTTIAQTPGLVAASLAGSARTAFIPKTYAEELNNGYDYGIPKFGYSLEERNDPKNDPKLVAEELYSIIDRRTEEEQRCRESNHGPHPPNHECDYKPSNMNEFNELYGKCFGARIIEADLNADPETDITGVERFEQIESVNYFMEDEEKGGMPGYCKDNDGDGMADGKPDEDEHLLISQAEAANDLRLYRFYLGDTVTGHSMACYEGNEASCDLFNINGKRDNITGGSDIIDGFQFPLITTKSQVGESHMFSNGTTEVNHPYIAYDIFVEPGTPVVSSTAGKVTRVNPSSSCPNGKGVSLAIQIYNEEENKTFFYVHLRPGSEKVTAGQTVEPGTVIGEIGGKVAACDTPPHLHIDATIGTQRNGCSRENPNAPGCPTVDLGRELYNTYQTLPE